MKGEKRVESLGTIAELKKMLQGEESLSEELEKKLASDGRLSVQKLYRDLLIKQQKKNDELKRLKKLFLWEESLIASAQPVAGVDEAGRGPLAGPVTAAAVILDSKICLPGLNDSKKITAKTRDRLSRLIKEKAVAWSVGWATVEEIDCLNIHNAGFLAMKRAIAGLTVRPNTVLVDGFEIPEFSLPQIAIQKGDSISASIAAASIIAKVARDKVMEELHQKYPVYGFLKHKGYPTKEHLNAIKLNGSSPVHRQTFKGVM